MFQRKYYFDPQTLRYIQVKRNLKTKFVIVFAFFIFTLPTAVYIYNLSVRLGINPKVSHLRSENENLISRYEKLNEKIGYYDKLLDEYQVIDDSIYRCILGLEPIPFYVRGGGLGGTNPYSYLDGYATSQLMINTSRRLDHMYLRTDLQFNSFSDLSGVASERTIYLRCKPSIQPVSLEDFYWISSDFGIRIDPLTKVYTSHYGLDFAGKVGLNIYATGDGVVDYIKISNGGYGKEVVIDHGFGYSSRYAHLSRILVHKGQKIKRGELVGILGTSGKSTGPHLHYEVRFLNKPLNPFHFFSDDLSQQEYQEIISLSNKIDN